MDRRVLCCSCAVVCRCAFLVGSLKTIVISRFCRCAVLAVSLIAIENIQNVIEGEEIRVLVADPSFSFL